MNLFDIGGGNAPPESTAARDRDESEDASLLETPKGVPPIEDLPEYEGVTEGFSPTDEQRQVLGHVEFGNGHGVVEAVAGSGKTDVLIACARLVSNSTTRCLICALNKSVQKELNRRVRRDGVDVTTIHKKGRSALEDARGDLADPESRKMEAILEPMITGTDLEPNTSGLAQICRLIKLTRRDLQNEEAIRQMVNTYGKKWDERYTDLLPRAIERSNEETWDEGRIDYADMLYVPLEADLLDETYDWVFVDEAQDLARAQQQATLELRKPEGRSLYVGDQNQAIYGFQGAQPDSMDQMKEHLDATELTMSISFRCPRRHVAKTQEIVPDIQPADGADAGTIKTYDLSSLPEVLQPGDLVLARFNNVLVKWCLKTVEHGTEAYLKGDGDRHDLGSKVQKTLRRAVKDVEGKNKVTDVGMTRLRDALRSYRHRASEVAEERDWMREDRIQRQADAALAISKRIDTSVDSVGSVGEQVLQRIRTAFANPTHRDSNTGGNGGQKPVEFSTIHKAKGREASRVGIINPDFDASDEGDPSWLSNQEKNLRYVMLTRSADTLLLFREGGAAAEEADRDVQSNTYLRLQKEKVSRGDRLMHKEHGTGTVVTVDRAEEGKMIMRFSTDIGHREVALDRKVFRWT